MTVSKPITMLAICSAVLALGLAALFYDQHGIVPFSAPFQHDVWARLGAAELARPLWAKAAEIGFSGAAGAVTIFLLLRTRIHRAGLFVLGALATAFTVALMLARAQAIALNVLAPAIVLVSVFAAGAWVRFSQTLAFKRGLRFAFADSLPRAAIERIARDPALLSLEGETRGITYLACGLRGLGELAIPFRDNPKNFTKLLEDILTPLMSQTLQHGGVIDRLTTDGFTAYWNAPLDDAEHAAHACEAANGMMAAMTRLNEDLIARYRLGGPDLPPVEIGIGIASGPVIAGGFGRHGRLRYGVNGDAVRLASLLQTLSRNYGPAVIVAEETQRCAAQGFAFLEVDYVAEGDSDPPIRLYAMLDSRSARASPKIRALVAFHEHIFQCLRNQQWDKARALVEQCSRLSGACHTLYELYLTRIRYFESNPPGPGWDGAFRPVLK
ncbi:MAG: adenylate/guanylate cyclase domain-containing protein [Rhizomicrobium sp.]